MTRTYKILVSGCDDETVVTVELTDDEIALVRRIAAEITAASESVCMPMMKVVEVKAGESR